MTLYTYQASVITLGASLIHFLEKTPSLTFELLPSTAFPSENFYHHFLFLLTLFINTALNYFRFNAPQLKTNTQKHLACNPVQIMAACLEVTGVVFNVSRRKQKSEF
jgi:hypothetical protein